MTVLCIHIDAAIDDLFLQKNGVPKQLKLPAFLDARIALGFRLEDLQTITKEI